MSRITTPSVLILGVLAAAPALPATASEADTPLVAGSARPSDRNARAFSASEQRMREDQDRFDRTVLGGALMGGVTGATTGALDALLRGRNPQMVREAALRGVLAGVLAGSRDGLQVAQKEREGRTKVRELQAAAAEVKQANQKLQSFLDSAAAVLAEGRARLTALAADLATRRISAQEAERARARETQNMEAMQATLDSARKTRDQYRQAAAKLQATPQDRRDLDAEMARMNGQVAQLEGNNAEYNRALQVSKA